MVHLLWNITCNQQYVNVVHMNTGTSCGPSILCSVYPTETHANVHLMYKNVHSCFTYKSPQLYRQCHANKNDLTLTSWMHLLNNSGPKKPYTKEYCKITLITSSKVNKTKLHCLGIHIIRLKLYRYLRLIKTLKNSPLGGLGKLT